jgi:RNA polymerase sigma-70 factor (family 1)
MEMIERIRSGDATIFKELFFQYYPALVIFAGRYIKQEDAAKDIVQNVFVKIYERRSKILLHSDIKYYLYKAVYNECVTEARRVATQKKHLGIVQKSEPGILSFDEGVEQTENERKLLLAIEKLPLKCKEILIMSKLEGMTNHEIARQLDLSKRTVETQISRALKKLRKGLSSVTLSIF